MTGKKIIAIIMGIFMIFIGIVCVTSPVITYGTIALILGFAMMIESISDIANWDERKKLGFANGFDLAGAIISLILSIILISSFALRFSLDLFLLILAAIWMIVKGIVRIITAFKIKKVHKKFNTLLIGKRWYIPLILGILMVILGILCLIHPLVLALTIGVFIGVQIIVSGIELIVYSF